MKKLLAILLMGAVLWSCGSEEEKKSETSPAPDTTAMAPGPDTSAAMASDEHGLELIGSSDCMACHAIDRKIIGPAYKDVAAKYEATEANIDTLVSKIKKGGSGNWGQVMMTAHPDIPDADVKEMVKYILSLKNK